MKNNRIFLFVAFATSALLFSCTKDNTDPTISDLMVTGTASQDSTVTITATLADAEGLKTATIVVETGGSVAKEESMEISGTSYNYSYSYKISSTASNGQVYKFTLKVTDDAKEPVTVESSTTATVPTPVVTNGIVTYSGKTLHALVTSTSGNQSLYSITSGVIYNTTSAASNQAAVDLVYYYGSSNLNTFAAPSDSTVTGDGVTTFNVCTSWTTKNATKFEKVTDITASQFDAASTDVLFADSTVSNASRVTMLIAGNIIAFETAGGKKGLIKITAAPAANNGDLTFDMKIQD